MPGLYKDEGVVLKAIKLGEADRILTLFTQQNGKVHAVAKGVRKTKSRFGGRLEPFTQVQLLVYRGRNLDTITGADIVEPFKGVRSDYPALAAAACLAELVDKVTPDRERSIDVYALLLGGLHALATHGASTIVPAFYVKLLSIAGYHPQLRACVACGSRSDLTGFSAALGGVLCIRCADDDPDVHGLRRDRLSTLDALLVSDFGRPSHPEVTADLTRLLRSYAEYHLERRLRSLDASVS